MPSRQDRRKVKVGSISFLILISASRHHRSAGIQIDFVGISPRIFAIIRIPAINLEFPDTFSARQAP